jgi:hypothetical protein
MKIIKIFGVSIIAESFSSGNKFLSFERNGETYLQFSLLNGPDICCSIYRTKTSQYELGVNKNGFYCQVAV